MMKYKIGHKIWAVKSRLVQEETKVDENGIVWKRANLRNREYYIIEGQVVGRMKIQIDGYSLWDDEPFYSQYSVKFSDGFMDSVSEDDMDGAQWGVYAIFHSKEEAEEDCNRLNK